MSSSQYFWGVKDFLNLFASRLSDLDIDRTNNWLPPDSFEFSCVLFFSSFFLEEPIVPLRGGKEYIVPRNSK